MNLCTKVNEGETGINGGKGKGESKKNDEMEKNE